MANKDSFTSSARPSRMTRSAHIAVIPLGSDVPPFQIWSMLRSTAVS
jgi:hypothetical protein